MRVLVSTEDMALANYLFRVDYLLTRNVQSLTLPLLKPSTLFQVDPRIKELYSGYVKQHKEYVKEYRKERIDKYIKYFRENYYHAAYAYAIPMIRSVVLSFIAWPPQVSIGRNRIIHPGAYINMSFIPTKINNKKIHRPLISKYTYSRFYNVSIYHLKKYLESHLRLKLFYYKKINQYVEAGKSESHAKRLARRDVFRIFIGNIWLVQLYFMVKYNHVSPEEIELPYHLAKDPLLHADMVNPADIVDFTMIKNRELREDLPQITWRWLLETVGVVIRAR